MSNRPAAQPREGSSPAGLTLEYRPLSELVRWPRNPKGHDLPELERSMRRFGFTAPVIVDETSGRLVAGHGRLEALQALRDTHQPPPQGILERDGAWLLPVVRGVAFDSEIEAEAYVIGDNALTMLGGWLEEVLTANLKRVHDQTGNLEGTGFTVEALDNLLSRATPDTPEEPPTPAPDELAALVRKWGVAPGDLWLLGPHRLVCGDSTDPATLARARGEQRPVLMWSDPPYGIGYEGHQATFGKIANDSAPFTAYLPLQAAVPVWYVCTRWDVAATWMQAITDAGHTLRNWIVWHKSRGGIGDTYATYRPTHEAILHAERRKPKDTPKGDANPALPPTPRAGRYQRAHETVLFATEQRVGFAHGGRDSDVWHHPPDPATSYLHPTQKPVSLPARAMRNHSRVGDVIIDPFCGSGAGLLAAHQLDRIAVALELDPRYVAATLERATTLGLEPRKETP